MNVYANRSRSRLLLSGKIAAFLLVVVCVVIGVVGLVLPVIPGLLFLAVAAFIVARHVPWIDARLRKHRTMRHYMSRADGFVRLRTSEKVRVAGLLCAKMLLDALDFVATLIARLGGRSSPERPR